MYQQNNPINSLKNTSPMKNKLHQTKHLMTLTCILFFAFLLAGNVGYAQTENRNSKENGTDPVQTYILKRPDSPVVQLYKSNPNDAELLKAIKLAMILENPGAFPEFTKEDLTRMQNESTVLNQQFKQVEEMVKQGNSYERAKQHVQRNAKNDQIQPSEAPALMVAPGQ